MTDEAQPPLLPDEAPGAREGAPARLIVFAGPRASGKTTLARHVARELPAVYLAKDTLKDRTLALAQELQIAQAQELAGPLSYELLVDLARDNLSLGLSVVVDSPAGFQLFREKIIALAKARKVELRLIECLCSDEQLLRERVERGGEGLPPHRVRDWDSYQRERAQYERISGPRLVVDTADPVAANTRKVLNYLSAGPG